MKTLLIVEDDRSLREGLATNFTLRHWRVLTAADGRQGLSAALEDVSARESQLRLVVNNGFAEFTCQDRVAFASNPAFDASTLEVWAPLLNGGTVVIGGIFEQTEIEDVTKVPLLGDIPIMGNLFKNKSKTSNKSELLVFITPRVISDRGVMR